MIGSIDPVVGSLAAAVVAALATYLVAAKRFSGTIGSSEATDLWAEARSIRESQVDRERVSQKRIDFLEERVMHLEKENAELRKQIWTFTRSDTA